MIQYSHRSGGIQLRLNLLLIIVIVCFALSASAETFLLKSGKKIEGTIRYEEVDILRIVDSSGIAMNLRKSSLDFEAMRRMQAAQPPPIANETAQSVQENKRQPATIYTNHNIHVPQGDIKTRLRKAEADFNRLKAACRAAGQSSPSMVVWNSTTYVVNGKPVTVAGYWAHPDNVARAKRTCENAIRAEQELKELKQAGEARNPAAGAP